MITVPANYLEIHSFLRNTALHGFAAYGAASAYHADKDLSSKIGVIYAVASSLLGTTNMSQLVIDGIAILAGRHFKLIKDSGTFIFVALALLRFSLNELASSSGKTSFARK